MPINPLPDLPFPKTVAVAVALLASASFSPAESPWVEETLAGMTLEDKAAQMMMIATDGNPINPGTEAFESLDRAVREQRIGGVILMGSEAQTIPHLLDELQSAAVIPLIVAMDMERSLAFRVAHGSVDLPFAMAVGATGSSDAARFLGEVTAREARALGIHWAFGPVVDVNNNPDNPVINIRSFGEDPEVVARLARAFIEGAKAGGLLTTAKHFPGHGDTAVDSHLDLPVLPFDRARLESIEWPPFRAAIEAGVDSIMVGHIAVPKLDPSGRPASLSPILNADILRDDMGFEGLIVTDALDMKGVHASWSGKAVVDAVGAGADVVLMPRDLTVAVQSLVRAVREGQLAEARLDASVRRILEAKFRLGLVDQPLVDAETAMHAVGRPADIGQADAVARASITVVRNSGGLLPLHAEEPLRLLNLVLVDDLGFPRQELARRAIDQTTIVLQPEVTRERIESIVEAAPNYTHILVSISFRRETLSPSLRRLVDRLAETGIPMIAGAFGSPYALDQLPRTDAALCTYGTAGPSRKAAVAALFGEFDIRGTLPVTLSESAPMGFGEPIPRRAMSLQTAPPESVGFSAVGLEAVDRILDDFVARGAFPGGVVAVGRRGALVHLHAFGHQTDAPDAPAVTEDTLYDLASLTKVIATTTMAMMLVDRGDLSLETPVHDVVPGFHGPLKYRVTVRHLLTHSSGLDAWAPLHETVHDWASAIAMIESLDLVYEPGAECRYSDLGMILLGEVLSRVAGRPLDRFVADEVFGPLGMTDTGYRPAAELLPRIAPTEVVPERGGLVHGVVHDENTFAMGGIAPHAGLFGTAGDLARFAQMILNGGVFEHHRLISRPTVELFTRVEGSVDGSTRALGWDTKSAEHSSAGTLFSPNSFGHLGFTGTSLWIDPERELFLILLTNRVYPTRENQLHREARPAVADAVIEALNP